MGVQDIGYIYVSYAQICAMPKTHSAGAVKLHIPLTAVNFDILHDSKHFPGFEEFDDTPNKNEL